MSNDPRLNLGIKLCLSQADFKWIHAGMEMRFYTQDACGTLCKYVQTILKSTGYLTQTTELLHIFFLKILFSS